jgi:gamma-glutamyltranspeptidase/glutathione hydrolase
MKQFPNVKETYTSDGKIPGKGDLFRNPFLAETYKKIAKGDEMNFIKERLLKLSLVLLRNKAVFLAMKILSHHSEWVDPVSTNYRGYDVWELPPNGQGWQRYKCLI